MKIVNSDCLEYLKQMPDNSIDAIVTDPPYGLSFMGKKWDYDVPSQEIWEECLRVLKPGGYLLSFAGTRTQHRMAVRIEDAGFEIRDMIAWIYASGFPKSLNIGKQIDKIQGNEREVVGHSPYEGRRPNKFGGKENGDICYGDSGSAARFFYCAKASKSERNRGCEDMEERIVNDGREKDIDNAYQRGTTLRKNTHPTVKPIALMEYLVKLVSKEGHTVLDPFMGSGSTGIACKKLGREFIGIERESDYCKIAEARIGAVQVQEEFL